MNDVVRLNGVSVDVEEARKALAEYDAKQAAKQAEAEKLYDGLTLEQWQYVKEGEFYCQFWDYGDVPPAHVGLRKLHRLPDDDAYFQFSNGIRWRHCRPAQVYGVRHPCFGKRPEWLKDSDLIVMAILDSGKITVYSDHKAEYFDFTYCKEFIAMPAGGKIE